MPWAQSTEAKVSGYVIFQGRKTSFELLELPEMPLIGSLLMEGWSQGTLAAGQSQLLEPRWVLLRRHLLFMGTRRRGWFRG